MNQVANSDEGAGQKIAVAPPTKDMRGLIISAADGGVTLINMEDAKDFAKMMSIAGVAVPAHLRGNPGACLAIIIQSLEWRMSPYSVANKSYSVNDRMAYEAQLIAAVILQRAPIKGRFKHRYQGVGDKRTLTIWAELRDYPGEMVEITSPPIGIISPKNSPLWKTNPDLQLYYHTERNLCRMHFPDVLLGVYAEDEIDRSLRAGGARDVTPKRSLSAQLDALAEDEEIDKMIDAAAEDRLRAEAEFAQQQPDHDPDTGEVIDAKQIDAAIAPAKESPAEAAGSQVEVGGDEDTEEETLLASARAAAENGIKKFRFWKGKLTDNQLAMLAPHAAGLDKFAATFDNQGG